MPRNPGNKKHAHNNRHENGVVVPEKKVAKQRSNGHLNGTVKVSLPSEPTSGLPPTDPAATPATIDPVPITSVIAKHPGLIRQAHPTLLSRDSESSLDGLGGNYNAEKMGQANGVVLTSQRRSDVGLPKVKTGHDLSALQIASTILRSRPACDTVALLIVLLALPSLILTIVQALFASLTLMPGSGLSPISFFSLFDVFQSSAGSPSLWTMAVVDLICFALWITLWPWAKNFALDLAQVQIAITLGNGTSTRSGGVNTICFVIVLFLHSIRSRGIRQTLIRRLVPTDLISQTRLADFLQYLPSDADFGESPGSPGKFRSLFAVHIISQALMAFVRRRVANSQMAAEKASKRADMEAAAGSGTQEGGNGDPLVNAAVSTGVDYQQQQPPPTPGLKDGKEKGMSAKKRRRQANHVRSRQPFWAALASTKVHVARELDHSRGINMASPSQPGPYELPRQNIVWITRADPSEIHFDANFIFSNEYDQMSPKSAEYRPFYARVNGAKWQAFTLDSAREENRADGEQLQWTGIISGLAPNCPYTCSFIRSDNDEEITSVTVKTPPLLDKDSLNPTTPVTAQPTRPSSPSTTLKNSIATAEGKLNDARNRLARFRKQHRGSLNKVEKEVELNISRLKSAGDDTKQRNKLSQAERLTRAQEDGIVDLNKRLGEMDSIPEEENEEYTTRKKEFEQQNKLLAEASASLSGSKSSANNELACVNNELSNLTSRKERLTSRQAKLTDQYDRITQANMQGMDEKERKAGELASRQADQLRRETDLSNHVNYLAKELRDVQMRTHACWRQIENIEKQDMSQRESMLKNNGPLTPEGDLPGSRVLPPPQTQSSRPFAFGSFQPVPQAQPVTDFQSSPFLAYAKTLPSDGRRPRSNTNQSMGALSNVSADFEDADPIPPMPINLEYDATGRKDSGSSRGQNNGSPAAGVIGNLRSPTRSSHSPGHIPGTTNW